MGTLRKRGNGYYAEVCIKQQRKGKTCRTKAEATAWIKEMESGSPASLHTVGDLFDYYQKHHSTKKKTATQEKKRCERLADQIGRESLLANADYVTWRNTRLAEVKAASVRRDWNLLNAALNVAVRELKWLPSSPLTGIERPAGGKPRNRTWTQDDIDRFLWACGWPGDTIQAKAGDCLLFALETAMRASEITTMQADQVHGRYVHLPETKNGNPRDVPLSKQAKAILDRVGVPFGITNRQLDALSRKAIKRAGLVDIRFHDTRRTALTRMSKKLAALELARVSGHKDLRILLETYYKPEIEDLADKLD